MALAGRDVRPGWLREVAFARPMDPLRDSDTTPAAAKIIFNAT